MWTSTSYLVYMQIFNVVILAFVQGITEFLPVSSSGHLVVARVLLGIPDVEGTAFDAFLHLGTLAAVLMYYWRVWWDLMRSVFVRRRASDKQELLAKIAIATVPAAIVGYLFADGIGELLRDPLFVSIGLFVTAVILFVSDFWGRRSGGVVENAVFYVKQFRYVDALIVGLVQVTALVPGVSRSGVTIASGMWRGLSKKQAVSFSFLLSAPIIAGAGFAGISSVTQSSEYSLFVLVVGFVISFVVGLTAIRVLLWMVERMSFRPFAAYLVVLASVLLFFGYYG